MNICFLAHAGSIHTKRWASYFVARGHKVSIISFTPSDPVPGADLYLLTGRLPVSYERSNWHYLLRISALRRLLKEIQPDLINAHFLSSYGFFGALLRASESPLVITLHGSDILLIPRRSIVHKQMARFALNRADMVISVAQHMTDLLPQYMDKTIPVLTIQYGLDLNQFSPRGSLENREPTCFSNRALVPVSNLETLILAGQVLDDQDSCLIIKMAGVGEQLTRLRHMVEERQLTERVRFIGQLEHEKVPEFLRTVAIFVSVSSSDGTPLSLLEAMACGAFPIVSDIPANREWIRDGYNGFIVPMNSPEKLAIKLQEAWANIDLRNLVAKRNWNLIREKANYEKNMAIIEQAYINLVHQEI